jgi:hypothetical protein
VPARRGSWSALSPRTRGRWVGAFGGESQDPVRREARARFAYETGATIPRAEAGHEPAGVREGRTITALIGPDAAFVEFRSPTRGEARRLGRYDQAVGDLARGRLSPAAFRRKVSSWRAVAGQHLTADPAAVLARLDQLRAADVDPFAYRSGRAA